MKLPGQTDPQAARGGRLVSALVAGSVAASGVAQLLRPGQLTGTTRDNAVYLGAAVSLVHGAMPYRSFVFVQPPGIVLYSVPEALLSDLTGTRVATAVLRLSLVLVLVASALLAARVMAHRGPVAAGVAGLTVGLMPAQLYAARNDLLEPVLNLLILGAVALLFTGDTISTSHRHQLGAGILLAAAVAVKLPAAPALVAALIICSPWRRGLSLVLGMALGAGAICLPFLVAAPGAMVSEILGAQLGRVAGSGRVPLATRLHELVTLTLPMSGAWLALAIVVLVLALVAGRWRQLLTPGRLAVFSALVLAMGLVLQLVPGQYYSQYAAPLAVPLALLGGALSSHLPLPRSAATVWVPIAATIVVIGLEVGALTQLSGGDPGAAIQASVPDVRCIVMESPALQLTSNRFTPPSRDCPSIIDIFGTGLSNGSDSRVTTTLWLAWVGRAPYLVGTDPVSAWEMPQTTALQDYVASHFRFERRDGLCIYVRVRD